MIWIDEEDEYGWRKWVWINKKRKKNVVWRKEQWVWRNEMNMDDRAEFEEIYRMREEDIKWRNLSSLSIDIWIKINIQFLFIDT